MGYWSEKIKKGTLALGQESIRFQDPKKLNGLAELIGKWRENGDYSPNGMNDDKIVAYVYKTFGLTISIKHPDTIGMGGENSYFLAVEPPKIDKNSPLIPNVRRYAYTNTDITSYKAFTKNRAMVGFVDRENAVVSGAFSELMSPVFVGEGLLRDENITDLELASGIAHELGHVFTFFEEITSTLITNFVAEAAARQCLQLTTRKERVELITEAGKELNVNLEDVETIADGSSPEVVYTHLVSDVARHRNDITGSTSFGNRQWERLSDDFATRLGGGEHIISLLFKCAEKNFFLFNERAYVNLGAHVTLELLSLIGFVAMIATGPVTSFLAGIFIGLQNPEHRIYDRPEERYINIRNIMVESIKETNDAARKKELAADIDRVDEMIKDIKDKYLLFEAIYLYAFPSGRKTRKSIEFNQTVESLISNNLFHVAAKL